MAEREQTEGIIAIAEDDPPNFLATITLVLGSAALAVRTYSLFYSPVLYRDYPIAFMMGGLAALLGWVAIRNPERPIQALIGIVFGFVAFFSSFTPIAS